MNCNQCGAQLSGFETNCPTCGAPVANNNPAAVQQPQVAQPAPAVVPGAPEVSAQPAVAQPMPAAVPAAPEVPAQPAAPAQPAVEQPMPAQPQMVDPQAMGYGDMSAPQVNSLSEAQGEVKPAKKLSGRTIGIIIALIISIIIAVVYYGFIY